MDETTRAIFGAQLMTAILPEARTPQEQLKSGSRTYAVISERE